MSVQQPVAALSNSELLAAFGTSEDPENWGFDEATQARVMAQELVRARGRLAYYRTLYTSFASEGQRYMIENLADDEGDGGEVPAKLAFTNDDERAQELMEDEDVTVWTEAELLDALRQEVTLHDYFTDLLDELALR